MSTQVGKSAGIALLMAAALLAALFAFGVFSPQGTPGVSAHECQSPGDDHEDNTGDNPCNTDANNDGTVDDLGDGDTAHAEGDHVIPTFSGSAYDSEEERYEFSIRENRDGSTTAITLGQVIATLPGGGDVDLDFTFTPNSGAGGAAEADFDDYPSGHVVYVGSGINFEAASTAETDPLAKDGDKKYIAGVFTVTARKEGAADADEGIDDRTATAAIRVYVEDQDAGPPAAPMGVPVGQRDSVAAVNADDGPPAVAAVFPKGALSATAARKAMDVTWDRPDGVVDASTYTVRYRKVGESDDDWDTMTVGVDTNVDTDGGADTVNIAPAMVTLTGLDEKAKYEIQVRVAASDTDDNDNEWSATGMGETASVPAAVKIAVTSEGQDSGELMVSWTNDDAEGTMHDGGGDSKAMYKVEYGERRSFDPVQDNTLRSFETGGSSTTIGGLDNGTLYHVRVTPLNRVFGDDKRVTDATTTPDTLETDAALEDRLSSVRSDPMSGTPYGEPSAPRNLQVVAVSQTALLANWQAPANMGGYASVNYDVTYQKVGDASTSMTMEDVGATSASIPGLEANTLYEVQVVATNPRGDSQPAVGFGRTVMAPAGPPAIVAPSLVQDIGVQVISDTEIFVSWNAPASNGGSDITGYSVQYKTIRATSWMDVTRSGANTGQTITGLTANTDYQVQVAAMNADHTGDYAQATGRTNTAAPGTITTKLTARIDVASSKEPGAAVELTLQAKLNRSLDQRITINLSKFGLPDSIDASNVSIRSHDGTTMYRGNPASVIVGGGKLNLVLGTLDGIGSTKILDTLTDQRVTNITIQQSAGIKNPTTAGVYDVVFEGSHVHKDTAGKNKATVDEMVTVKPGSAAKGSDITVSGKGFTSGTVTVVNTPEGGTQVTLMSNVAITDGSFEVVIPVGDAFTGGMNAINAIDSSGKTAEMGDAGTFTLKPKIEASPTEVKRGQELTIKISDWDTSLDDTVAVKFGGKEVTTATITTASDTIKFDVPSNARVGINTVSLEVGGKSQGSVNVTVDALAITVSPSSVVPGQQVTLTGSGFPENKAVEDSIMFGDQKAERPKDASSTSRGRIAVTVTVPLNVKTGKRQVSITVDGITGVAEIEVPKRSITVTPAESAPGTVVTVTGTGFASGKRVEVFYNDEFEDTGRADSSGGFSLRLTIPSDAPIGKTNKVKVADREIDAITASADHKTPGPSITLPGTAQVGTLMTISGSSFDPFSGLTVTIGGRTATPSPGPEADKNGAFSFQARVPRVGAGSHTVVVRDSDGNSASETFTVVTTAIVSTPAEVFGSLGDKLLVVWRYDNATSSWASYDPNAPAELNDLTGVSRGDIVWVDVTENVMFQGGTLYAGWNLISLE